MEREKRFVCVLCFYDLVVDSLHPFFADVESLRDNSESLLKMLKKVDAYTKSLETRANQLF